MNITYRFIPEGAVPEKIEPGDLYVAAGSVFHAQVFDHHAGKQESPGAMLWSARNFLSEFGKTQEKIIVCTHVHPDWNACWGICLVQWLFQGKEPDEAKVSAMDTFSSFILTGFNPSDGPVEKSLVAVFENLMAEIEENEQDAYSRDLKKR